LFDFDSAAIPETGFRYYRLVPTRAGNTAAGTAIGTGNVMIQFSYFGLISTYSENGYLEPRAGSGVTKAGDAVTIGAVNGPKILTLTGNIANLVSAPVSAMSYTSILKGVNIKIFPDTKLGYLFNPKDSISSHMAFDLVFTDGTRLKNLAAIDQFGVGVNPKAQGEGGKLKAGQWNYVEIELGKFVAGKSVKEILVGFEVDGAEPGQRIEGSFDYIAIFREGWKSEELKVYAALYSADGKMVDYGISDTISTKAFSSIILDSPIVLDAGAAGANSYAKVFFWDPGSFIPLDESIRYQF
jgi:hypothetical protein